MGPETVRVKLSPDAYHLWATDFWQAAKDFRRPPRFSPVPHFLACRAIELEIKSRLLRAPTVDVTTVKNKFKHDIFRAYKALDPKQQTLSKEEEAVLRKAEECYRTSTKYFEYWTPGNALTGYSKFPDAEQVYSIAAKLIEGGIGARSGSGPPSDTKTTRVGGPRRPKTNT